MKLENILSNISEESIEYRNDVITLSISKDQIAELLNTLIKHPDFQFSMLTVLFAID